METELHNPQGEHPEPKRKRRTVKRRARRAAPKADVTVAAKGDNPELEGISQSDCPFACDPDKCAITGINVCGHPHKGGLQSALLNRTDVVRRYQAARRIIAHQVTEKKT